MPSQLTIPKNSREAYQDALTNIKPKDLAKKLNISLTHAYRMGASKKTNGETRNNPVKQTTIIVKELIEKGIFGTAFIIADSIASLIGGEITFRDHQPDKETYQEEILDTAMATARLMDACQQYIDKKTSFLQMRWFKKRAHNEIDQLVAKAVQERNNRY